jgi:hypothetical protein
VGYPDTLSRLVAHTSSVYTNSLLASLNSRESLRGKGIEQSKTTETSTSFNVASTPMDMDIIRVSVLSIVQLF